ncbi:transcription elongation factor GreAB [Saccharopolyspora rhizosphaerae]|uniref:Transcription elongation factor GreAB n=1 Tax=Saccharopolyspora rhizosphaerae TaxID=2492662 RepID=A0A3R8NZW9_9PSEU|nr:GreA/GreB family elongation factor [Saccharopolyspora rhizosphaerae]RRO16894.1 transcription elongation factor GreAB [Saccharopolyspora rhizosphaerae]
MTTTQGHWMTQHAHDRLRAELTELLSRRTSTDGDVVVDEGRRRARIREIRDLLSHAIIGETPADDGVAEPGMRLTVRFDDGETETFLLGTRDGADDLTVYSPDSPLGAALIGARQGDERSYEVPGVGTVQVTLLKAVPHRA